MRKKLIKTGIFLAIILIFFNFSVYAKDIKDDSNKEKILLLSYDSIKKNWEEDICYINNMNFLSSKEEIDSLKNKIIVLVITNNYGSGNVDGKGGRTNAGGLYGRIVIPSIGIDLPLYFGTDSGTLSQGAGMDSRLSIPGEGGHVAVAGHRDTVFGGLGGVSPGDKILIETPNKTYVYTASGSNIVPSTDLNTLVYTSYECLTVYTCYPFNYIGDAPNRYILSCQFSNAIDRN